MNAEVAVARDPASRADPLVTLFACPKPFRGHIGVIQRNALASWVRLGNQVEVLLLGEEDGVADVASEFGIRQLPGIARNELGTPLLDSIFALAQREARGRLLCYANADIIFLDDFLPAVHHVADKFPRFLAIGQRWDLALDEWDFGPAWVDRMRDRLRTDGRPHRLKGSDYFVFPRGTFVDLPPFALGRAGWDNWMIFAGLAGGMPVVDASRAITVIHQDHDYGHLPEGKRHHRLPESYRNVELAGGRETIFTLRDADWELNGDGLVHRGWKAAGWRRGLEAWAITKLGPGRRARWLRMVLHPAETAAYYWNASRRRWTGSEKASARERTPWEDS